MFRCLGSSIGFTPISVTDWKEAESTKNRKNWGTFYLTMAAAEVEAVMELLCHVAETDKIKAAVKHSTRGALYAGAAAFMGGLVGGPPGIAVGAAVGGLLGSWITRGQFEPLPKVIRAMTECDKEKLYDEISSLIGGLTWADAPQLISLVMRDQTLKESVTTALINFMKKEFKARIKYET
ncbi:protein C19orf12 homolog isoform X3 [Pleurodeles waltl]|uniref:protein C19orf12 homolog isoform X3 n=1 Tax=Pleurodeles waltl TaxID=8319 RepID=UPI003709B9B7